MSQFEYKFVRCSALSRTATPCARTTNSSHQPSHDAIAFCARPAPRTVSLWVRQGCLCDDGFEGIDCAARSCKSGDDKNTDGLPEIQSLTCITGFDGTTTDGTKCFKEYPGVLMWDPATHSDWLGATFTDWAASTRVVESTDVFRSLSQKSESHSQRRRIAT